MAIYNSGRKVVENVLNLEDLFCSELKNNSTNMKQCLLENIVYFLNVKVQNGFPFDLSFKKGS